MKNVNLQVRINESLKQEVSGILKSKGLSYTSLLDALFRQIIEERRIPFEIILPEQPKEKPPTPSSSLTAKGCYETTHSNLKVSDMQSYYGADPNDSNTLDILENQITFDTLNKSGYLTIRINPKVKLLVTSILKELGLSISQTITLVSKQIQLHQDIPKSVQSPEWCDALNNEFWTEQELIQHLQQATYEADNQIGRPIEVVFNKLLDDLK